MRREHSRKPKQAPRRKRRLCVPSDADPFCFGMTATDADDELPDWVAGAY